MSAPCSSARATTRRIERTPATGSLWNPAWMSRSAAEAEYTTSKAKSIGFAPPDRGVTRSE